MSTYEPETPEDAPREYPSGVWMRALHMLVLAVLFGLAETILLLLAILQLGWMIFSKKRNPSIAQFGDQLGNWLRHVSRFQSGASDDKPFPWKEASN